MTKIDPKKEQPKYGKMILQRSFNLLIPNIKGRVIFTNKNKNKSRFI